MPAKSAGRNHECTKKTLLIISMLLFCCTIKADRDHELYFIDAHSQIDHKVDGLDIVLKRMSDNNVTTTLLSTRGKRNWQDILNWNSKYPTKIKPLIRSKGEHYRKNTSEYYKLVQKQINTRRFIGVAEVLVFHAQKGKKAPEIAVDLTDKRISLLLKESLIQAYPFIIHIEFASLHEPERLRQMKALNKLLEQNPKHPFVLIHMGQLNDQQTQKLIVRHSNIYFITSHACPVTVNKSRHPWSNLFNPSGYHFKKSWKNLFIAYPERFIFALDNVWDFDWTKLYDKRMNHWKMALSELPENTAHLIAHGNAERLWKLK